MISQGMREEEGQRSAWEPVADWLWPSWAAAMGSSVCVKPPLAPQYLHIWGSPAPGWIILWACMTQFLLGFLSIFHNCSEFIIFSSPLSNMCHKYHWNQEHLSPSWVLS